jgi:chorismate lyase/3-hydroxybenzoate synthase
MTQPQITGLPTRAQGHSASAALAPLRVNYAFASAARMLDALLAERDVLAVIGFGAAAPQVHSDPRYLRVALQPVDAAVPFEVWRTQGAVTTQRSGNLRWASDGDYAFAAIELDEAEHGDIESAAATAYRDLVAWLGASRTSHVLRIWNYLDAINVGAGDAERYRRFCSGRAAGLTPGFADAYPAATAVGVRDGRRVFQVYCLAARSAGAALENPRQVSAWHYPRQYGPQAPNFARAMRAPTHSAQLYISGTAAIVGHASHHRDDFIAQLNETLTNIDSLLGAAQIGADDRFGARCLLKAYVRRETDVAAARAQLQARLPPHTPVLLLRGDVCRSELLIEIDGVQGV